MTSQVMLRLSDSDDEVIFIEAEGTPPAGVQTFGIAPVAKPFGRPLKTIVSITDVAARLKPLVLALYNSLASEERRPDKIEVEFGVKLNAESGVVIAKAAAEGSIKLKLTWEKKAAGA